MVKIYLVLDLDNVFYVGRLYEKRWSKLKVLWTMKCINKLWSVKWFRIFTTYLECPPQTSRGAVIELLLINHPQPMPDPTHHTPCLHLLDNFYFQAFKFFPKDRKMALVQLPTVDEAITALVKLHNYQLSETSHLR